MAKVQIKSEKLLLYVFKQENKLDLIANAFI